MATIIPALFATVQFHLTHRSQKANGPLLTGLITFLAYHINISELCEGSFRTSVQGHRVTQFHDALADFSECNFTSCHLQIHDEVCSHQVCFVHAQKCYKEHLILNPGQSSLLYTIARDFLKLNL